MRKNRGGNADTEREIKRVGDSQGERKTGRYRMTQILRDRKRVGAR